MIKFTLKCNNDHRFESWFQSSDAYDKLLSSGMVECTICGSIRIEKALMAPRVCTDDSAPAMEEAPSTEQQMEQALNEMRRHVEDNSDYIGLQFAQEARAMHEGTVPKRAIYGEAKPEDAKKLIEDGVPVAPLPFIPKQKTN